MYVRESLYTVVECIDADSRNPFYYTRTYTHVDALPRMHCLHTDTSIEQSFIADPSAFSDVSGLDFDNIPTFEGALNQVYIYIGDSGEIAHRDGLQTTITCDNVQAPATAQGGSTDVRLRTYTQGGTLVVYGIPHAFAAQSCTCIDACRRTYVLLCVHTFIHTCAHTYRFS